MSSTTTDDTLRPVGFLDELRRIVPTEQIEPQPQSSTARGGSWAVEPATREELVDLMRWANERHAAVYTRHPRVGDGKICGPRPRIYLRGRRMRRVSDLDIVSGTITVQSGISMKELHELLAERSYTTGFAARPWRQESLGAILAAALDAHWGPRYGFMEEQVVGLGVVFPDGTAVDSRRAPRKAVGPDFDRLFLGSRGRFGIVYEATLRIYPAAARIVQAYGAPNLATAMAAVREGFEAGLSPRAAEIMTPAPDRAWGRKRVGLTDDLPVLLLVEPWELETGRLTDTVEAFFSERLQRLEPPVGWDIHEGLLPPPRAWTAPVVGVSWRRLEELSQTLGDTIPPGMWLVRVSRHGGWLSLASGMSGAAADTVRATVEAHLPTSDGPWDAITRSLKARLDPRNILNPAASES